MKTTFVPAVRGDRIATLLPPELAARVPNVLDAGNSYSLAYFRDSVVRSSRVAKLLRQHPVAAGTLVAAGHDFTVEAEALLVAVEACIVRRGSFGWSDARYQAIRDGR